MRSTLPVTGPLTLVNRLPSAVLTANSPKAKLEVVGTFPAVELRFNKI